MKNSPRISPRDTLSTLISQILCQICIAVDYARLHAFLSSNYFFLHFQEYLSRLRQIRLHNFNERRQLQERGKADAKYKVNFQDISYKCGARLQVGLKICLSFHESNWQ